MALVASCRAVGHMGPWCTGPSLSVEGRWASRLSSAATTGLTLGGGGCGVYLGIHVLCEQRGLVNLRGFGGKRLTESVEGWGDQGRLGQEPRDI